MTTKVERQRILVLYLAFKGRRAEAERVMNDNKEISYFNGGISDEVWEAKDRENRNRNYDYSKGVRDAYDAAWVLVKNSYSDWDINLAIQEGEGRIGDLPVIPDGVS